MVSFGCRLRIGIELIPMAPNYPLGLNTMAAWRVAKPPLFRLSARPNSSRWVRSRVVYPMPDYLWNFRMRRSEFSQVVVVQAFTTGDSVVPLL